MLKKIILASMIVMFSSFAVFAQTAAQIEQARKYLETPESQKALGYKEEQKKQEALSPAVEKEGLSELEQELSANLPESQVLEQYGYDIFKTTVASFTPPNDVPVGPDYLIGPGDSFNITLWGITEGIFKVEVNQEGDIILPKVGVVKVVGLTYGELKPYIEQQLRRYYESVNVGITIDQLRTIRVYVVGEVAQPGSYSISSLSTVYTALFNAGGPTKKGTLRNVELRRNNKIIAHLDLYRFLLSGDKSQDEDLQSGDTIFVPRIGKVAGISGAVFRPAIYEIKGEADLSDLIYLAGGFLPSSYLNRVQVRRVVAHEKKIVRDENISRDRMSSKFGFPVQDMDFVEVFPIFKEVANLVSIAGEAKYPGTYELKEGMRIKDLLPSPADFTFNAYLPHIEIIRTDPETRKIKVYAVDFEKLYAGDESQNMALESMDQIVVSSIKKEPKRVILKGEISRPGEYVFSQGEKLSSVLKRAGGFTEDAYLYGAVFVRKLVKDIQMAKTQQFISKLEEEIASRKRQFYAGLLGTTQKTASEAQLDQSEKLLEILRSKVPEGRIIIHLKYPLENFEGSESDIELEDGDELNIPAVSKVVNVLGEVYNPSALVYVPSQKAKAYLRKVGGFTKNADQGAVYIICADGSVISREQGVNIMGAELMPGDTLVVPQIIEMINIWATIKDWTRWAYEATLTWAIVFRYLQ